MEALIPSATELRLKGQVAGERPEVHLEKSPLEIKIPSVKDSPKSPVDTIIILGMGPVEPVLVGSSGHRRVSINKARMRNNAAAAGELIARGFIKDGGTVVPSGTSTADPNDIAKATNLSPDEAVLVDHTSEAELMTTFIKNQRTKVKNEKGKSITVEDKNVEIVPDHLATETADNFIYTLNELDRRSRAENGKLFDGSMIVVTSRYHVPRTMEVARYLNIGNQVVPLVSQDVLETFGYGKEGLSLLGEAGYKFDISTRENEVKWIHAIREMPEYFLPVLGNIEDDERFISTLKNLHDTYGKEKMSQMGITDINLYNIGVLRSQITSIIRKNPANEDWFAENVGEVNVAINGYEQYTKYWLSVNAPSNNKTSEPS